MKSILEILEESEEVYEAPKPPKMRKPKYSAAEIKSAAEKAIAELDSADLNFRQTPFGSMSRDGDLAWQQTAADLSNLSVKIGNILARAEKIMKKAPKEK